MFRRTVRSIVAFGALAAALAVSTVGTTADSGDHDGTNWGRAAVRVVAPR